MNVIQHKKNNPYKLNKHDLVEIDVIRHLDNIYTMHDVNSPCICTIDDYLKIAARKEAYLVAINLKEKGLEEKVIKLLDKYDIPGFAFPDASLKQYDLDLKYKGTTRIPLMIDENNPFIKKFEPKEWIWLHTNNKDTDFLTGQYKKIRKKSPYVGICFSGIHNLKKDTLKELLYTIRKDNNTYICTDYGDNFYE